MWQNYSELKTKWEATVSDLLLEEAYIGPRNVMTLLSPTYLDAARAKPCKYSRIIET